MPVRFPVLAALLFVTACAPTRPPLPELVSDRPDATESAVAVSIGHVQVEAGYTFLRVDERDLHTLGEVLSRIGVAGGLELRLGLSSVVIESSAGTSETALDDASLGAKLELPATRLFPETAVLVATSVPVGDAGFTEDAWRPGILLASAWSLTAGVDAGVNAGWRSTADGGDWVASAALGLPVSDEVGAFVETFGAAWDGDHQLFIDGGFTWGLTHDLQLDVRAGTEIGGAGERFVGAGLVARW